VRAVLTLLVLAVSLVLVAGCGGGDEDSASGTEAWAEDFCATVSAWTDELRRIGDTVDDPSTLSVDALREAADDVGSATDDFVDDVRALDGPDTESGDEVERSLETLADTLEEERADLGDAIDDLSGITDVPAAITAIGSSLSAMGTAFQQAFDAIEDADARGELETAFEEADACDELTG
jgi:hypothetical protein